MRTYITPYRLFWAVALSLFALFIYWLLFIRPNGEQAVPIDSSLVKSDAVTQERRTLDDISETMGELGLNVEGFDLSLSSLDGELILRLWADKAVKLGEQYSLGEGTVLFVLPNQNKLLLRLDNCEFSSDTETVSITGSITGQILDTGQYFTAAELYWYRDSETVNAQQVIYYGPRIEVQGNSMAIDLKSGKIDFTGPVYAGV